jgi:hypothetical protein
LASSSTDASALAASAAVVMPLNGLAAAAPGGTYMQQLSLARPTLLARRNWSVLEASTAWRIAESIDGE